MGEPQNQHPTPVEPDEEGNYTSRPLAALRLVWDDYQEGVATEENVINTLNAVADFAQYQIQSLESQVEAGFTDPESPSAQLIVDAFDAHLDALELMAEHFEDPEQNLFEKGLEFIQEATNQIMEAHHMIMEHIQAIAFVNCMFCGQKNDRSGEKCQKCGRPLQLPGETQSSLSLVNQEGLEAQQQAQGEITTNCARLGHAMVGWRGGHLDSDGLMSEIEIIEENNRTHLTDNQELRQKLGEHPPNRRQAVSEALSVMDQGLELSLAALEKMKLAFIKEDDTYLETGLTDYETATVTVVKAYRMLDAAAKMEN